MTVEQYHAAVRAGVFTEDDPIELLEGVLVQKMTKNPPHVLALGNLVEVVSRTVPTGWTVRSQDPITLADGEPEPDLVVVRGGRRDYLARHPGAADVALVVEVADSTLDRDRGIKLRSYARANLPVYWIVNLVDRCVEVYSAPIATASTPTYRTRATYGAGDVVDVVIDGTVRAQVRIDDVLP
jgi:Uma2 family endonuclease